MLQKYSIKFIALIIFFFGLTLIPVSLASAFGDISGRTGAQGLAMQEDPCDYGGPGGCNFGAIDSPLGSKLYPKKSKPLAIRPTPHKHLPLGSP